ncbi:sulfolipid-1 biosynthesis phthioceranic/hydroxyphthioceranic acid synthase [Amycolatopsis sulphurea]|nr:type I polyketide synthase [Amycolatopsis sulphurea]
MTTQVPVAVIGIGCRLPGGIDSPESFWHSLVRGDDLITEIPPERWDAYEHYDPERGVPGRSVSRWGGFLADISGFDASFFGIGEPEAAAMDPQHRLLLETAWEAVEHAGIPPLSLAGSLCGVFMGVAHDDYTVVAYGAGTLDGPYGLSGTAFSMASGRIAYALGLHGPAQTVDTACSSGLTSVHLGCRSLHEGESDLVLAGGCMVMLRPEVSASASAQGMLSPTGRCRAFDSAADGFVRSEGCAVVALKRLDDAQRDGDRILAVVRGTATNQDGRSETITMPAVEPQVAVYRAALAAGDVAPDSVGMVEAHGTGTPVGDPIEFHSLARVYATNGGPCAVGSVKTNLGHTESAAGTVGLVKAVLALWHGFIPPSLHFTELPEDLQQVRTGLFVPAEGASWPQSGEGIRRGVVSAFGMSGTNVHAVLEQAPASTRDHSAEERGVTPGPLLFPVSATSTEELRHSAARTADWVARHADTVAPYDLAYTLTRRREHRPVRAAVVASSSRELEQALRTVAEDETRTALAADRSGRGPVWVFSGQGSQWAAMGADLLNTEPVFASRIAELDPLIVAEAGFSVTEAMTVPEMVTGIDRVQPTLFAMQVAMAATMRASGVEPGAVIGHSLGEIAAIVVAGALSLEDGVKVICRRSRLCARLAGKGAMASVELPAQQVQEELAHTNGAEVVVSVLASPRSTVIGGEARAVRDLVRAWDERGVTAREVAVDVASHSPQVDSILEELAGELADLTPGVPTVPFYTATLDDARTQPACDNTYWVDNLRQPVRFGAAVQAALEDGYRVFAELAPHPLLLRAIEQTASITDAPVATVAAMRREQALPEGLRHFLSDLYTAGAAVDFSALYPQGRLVDAPLATWTHKRLLVRRANDTRSAHTVAVHPLLGAHVRLPEEPEQHAWCGDVGTATLPWLADHVVNGVPALPGAAFCEMALTAAQEVFGSASAAREVRFEEMLLLGEQTPVTTTAVADAPGTARFTVQTTEDGEHTRRASATLQATTDEEPEPPPLDVPDLLAAHPNRTDGDELRKRFDAERRIRFGPAMAGLSAVSLPADENSTLLAEVKVPAQIRHQLSSYGVHPVLLDSCIQAVTAYSLLRSGDADPGLMVPLAVDRVRLWGPARHARYCYARVATWDGTTIEADFDVVDEYGAVLLVVRGLRLGTRGAESEKHEQLLAQRLLTVEWEKHQPPRLRNPGTPSGTSWIVLDPAGTRDSLASGLPQALEHHGARCTVLEWPQAEDHAVFAAQLGDRLRSGGYDGVVVIIPPPEATDTECPARAREQVRRLVWIAGELVELADPPRLYVVTRTAQHVLAEDSLNLEQAGLRGLLRVIGAEHPHLHPTQIDVDDTVRADGVAQELLAGSDEDETAWRGSCWYAARLRSAPLRPDERRLTTVRHDRDGMSLQIRNPGDVETLEPVATGRREPGPGEIEIAVGAAGINFADVLNALGRYSSFEPSLPDLGLEFAGVVTAVGDGVTDRRVGERVGGYAPSGGTWGTFLICDAKMAIPVPGGLTMEAAAAVPVAYATAWHSLHDLVRIASGDRVLIHSATGGVGQAALAVARHAGAQIYATAGSPRRRDLLRGMGVEHVYDSRTTEFADLIRQDTDGYGVDIVLNSLPGPAQHAGIGLLSFGGRFVELGKKDVYTGNRLDLFPFRRNLAFFYVDLALMGQTDPDRIHTLLQTVYCRIADGALPAPAVATYPLSEAATVIRTMSSAGHTGKQVLTIPATGSSTAVVPPHQSPVFRRDGAYLITGGLGGLGLALADHLAQGGCGRIVLTSRSRPDKHIRKTIARIQHDNGVDVQVECGDIADPATATKLVETATGTGLRLRGVLHAAATVEDATLPNITDALLDRDWAAKADGAWHLHHATLDQPLDWFCAFSSSAALLGSPGQGAYAAANSWVDAFTHWRRAQGLPATTIAWGPWADIGRGAALEHDGRTDMIRPEEGVFAFDQLLRHTRIWTGYLPTTNSPWLTSLAERSPFAQACVAADDEGQGDTPSLRSELRLLPAEQRPGRLRRFLGEQAGMIVRSNVDPDRPFNQHGLDSLGTLELRTRIETELGIRLTPKDITARNTVRALAQHLLDILSGEEQTS